MKLKRTNAKRNQTPPPSKSTTKCKLLPACYCFSSSMKSWNVTVERRVLRLVAYCLTRVCSRLSWDWPVNVSNFLVYGCRHVVCVDQDEVLRVRLDRPRKGCLCLVRPPRKLANLSNRFFQLKIWIVPWTIPQKYSESTWTRVQISKSTIALEQGTTYYLSLKNSRIFPMVSFSWKFQ